MTTTVGTIHTLDRNGDTRLMWTRGNEDETTAARNLFNELRGKGYLAYRATGEKGERGEQIHEFDPEAERIIMVQQHRGG